ncbi:hypothetical protein CC80DRAFT_174703 [Byssothecium circinans]|uniref:Zn(2)-C6 fungal-type domain-containing protein n=1 Tax=Byssothecium circinans TaxID=147558 RepID=A0A6A5TIN0_9PLEO|nr:hypothetical protein CC80DRAFT_174703 [Byssothecium circinans]
MSPGPASKRKSCSDCVKAKRKCGMQLPRCSRCEKKNTICSYPSHNLSISDIQIPELEFSWLDELMADPNMMPWEGVLQPQLNAASNGTFTTGSSISDTQFLTPPEPIELGTTEEPEYLKTPAMRRPANTLSQAQTEAAVYRFKSWPEKWVKEGKAPFIHPRLYTSSMPHPLQDAYAACAIYSVKTAENENVAFTVIESKANELVRSPDQETWTPLDQLAAVQALLIFQFIRLFDGDVRQRAQAEKAEPILERWAEELKSRTTTERSFTTDTAPSWRSWIFAESTRRTILMSIFLAGVYSFVKNGFCTLGMQVAANSFTAQRRFWEAKSALEWERLRQSHQPYWIERLNFDHVVREGSGDEIDDFGVVLMISAKGADVVDDWMAVRSGRQALVVNRDIHQNLMGLIQTAV